jgi:hypothetical protein
LRQLLKEQRRLLLAQIELELREGLGEAGHGRRHQIGADRRDDAETQGPGQRLLSGLRCLGEILRVAQETPAARHHLLTRRGEEDAAAAAFDEPHAQPVLELLDAGAKRRCVTAEAAAARPKCFSSASAARKRSCCRLGKTVIDLSDQNRKNNSLDRWSIWPHLLLMTTLEGDKRHAHRGRQSPGLRAHRGVGHRSPLRLRAHDERDLCREMARTAHDQALRKSGVSRAAIQQAVRIASVIHAVAATLEGEESLAAKGGG